MMGVVEGNTAVITVVLSGLPTGGLDETLTVMLGTMDGTASNEKYINFMSCLPL